MKLDRTRFFGKVSPYWQPPEFDRPAAFEQDGRFFDVHDCEIVPGQPQDPRSTNAPHGTSVSSRRQEAITKEYESLLKIFGAMALGPYKYGRAQMRGAAALISHDALVLGVRVGEDELIKLLRQVAALISGRSRELVSSSGHPTLEDRNILLQLVGVMAKNGYGWCPSQARSKIATEIHNDAIAAGLNVDIDTVRKYLKLAAEQLWASAKL